MINETNKRLFDSALLPINAVGRFTIARFNCHFLPCPPLHLSASCLLLPLVANSAVTLAWFLFILAFSLRIQSNFIFCNFLCCFVDFINQNLIRT